MNVEPRRVIVGYLLQPGEDVQPVSAFQEDRASFPAQAEEPVWHDSLASSALLQLDQHSPAHAALTAAESMPVVGPIMQALDSLQAVTGLPWWAVISMTAIGTLLHPADV